jgi:hypothetical protein
MTGVKGYGFPATRKREERRHGASLPLWVWLLALAVLLWTVGAMQAWPQSSGLSSGSSSNDLTKWELLSDRFKSSLDGQSMQLRQALTELETSKASSQKLTLLLGQSLQANGRLKNYNAQMAARMQERDEELVKAYGDIDRLEQQRRSLIITVVVMGVIIAAGLLLVIIF